MNIPRLKDLMRQRAENDREIRAEGVNPQGVGFYGEVLLAEAFNLTLYTNLKGYDATDMEGNRVEIKTGARSIDVAFGHFDTFDHALVLKLDENYQPEACWKVSAKDLEAVGGKKGKANNRYLIRIKKIAEIGEDVSGALL